MKRQTKRDSWNETEILQKVFLDGRCDCFNRSWHFFKHLGYCEKKAQFGFSRAAYARSRGVLDVRGIMHWPFICAILFHPLNPTSDRGWSLSSFSFFSPSHPPSSARNRETEREREKEHTRFHKSVDYSAVFESFLKKATLTYREPI